MKVRIPDYYEDFKCIASECTDTCCAGWQVDVDDASYEYYKTVKGPIGERLKAVMREGKKGEEGRFEIRPDGRCPFLNADNLCDLYAELGEDALCVTCDRYPRYTEEFGNLKETGIALSCKTAAELILKENRTPFFKEYEDSGLHPSLNSIDADLFFALAEAREKAFGIVADRSRSIWDRMTLLMYYAADLQEKIKKPADMRKVTEKYTAEYMNVCISAVHEEKTAPSDIADGYKKIFYAYLKQVIIKREWPVMIDMLYESMYNGDFESVMKGFLVYNADCEYEYENIITYFIYRYFMKGVFDRDVLTKVKMGIISTLVICQCDVGVWNGNGKTLDFEGRIDIAHLYSREVEHSEENFNGLCRIFSKKRSFIPKKIVNLLQYNNM